jgi:agmatine deiminase
MTRRVYIALVWLIATALPAGTGCTDGTSVGDDDVTGDDDDDDDTTVGDDDATGDDDDDATGDDDDISPPALRVPGEWEPHAATWMQWPGPWESSMRGAFADIIDVVQDYEPVHLLTPSQSDEDQARQFLTQRGVPDTNITWHQILIDNAWMRDNGPVYVTDGTETWIADFRFDAWGGNFGGHIPWQHDDAVPEQVADYLGIRNEDHSSYVLERGNLEFNGAGTLVLNWDCQDDRNPGMTEAEHEVILEAAFGLSQVIWAYGHDPADLTTGHIDGYARFIDADTIAIGDSDWGQATEDPLADACEAADLEVVRIPQPGGTDYMNWLVGNGYVAGMAFGDANADAAAQAVLESLFPGRDVHMLDAATLWSGGGGIHCVTNDQPVLQ